MDKYGLKSSASAYTHFWKEKNYAPPCLIDLDEQGGEGLSTPERGPSSSSISDHGHVVGRGGSASSSRSERRRTLLQTTAKEQDKQEEDDPPPQSSSIAPPSSLALRSRRQRAQPHATTRGSLILRRSPPVLHTTLRRSSGASGRQTHRVEGCLFLMVRCLRFQKCGVLSSKALACGDRSCRGALEGRADELPERVVGRGPRRTRQKAVRITSNYCVGALQSSTRHAYGLEFRTPDVLSVFEARVRSEPREGSGGQGAPDSSFRAGRGSHGAR